MGARFRGAGPAVLAAGLSLGLAGTASASSISVCQKGCAYSSVSAAVAAAAPGDQIVVGPGTYGGGFTIGKSLSIAGAGSGSTIISSGDPVIRVGAGASVRMSGLRITGGSGVGLRNEGTTVASGIAVSGNGSDGVLNTGYYGEPTGVLTMSDSSLSGNAGAGIVSHGDYWFNPGTVSLLRVSVSGNASGGIANDAQMTVRSSSVVGNGFAGVESGGAMSLVDTHVDSNHGLGAAAFYRGGMTVSGGTVSGNTGVGIEVGGGMHVTGTTIAKNLGGGVENTANFTGFITLANVTISGNHARWGGGLYAADGSGIEISASRIQNNAADYGGGVATQASGSVQMTDTTVIGNSATIAGGGFYADEYTGVDFIGGSVHANRAPRGGAFYSAAGAYLNIRNSTVTGNKATGGPGSGGGIFNAGGFVTLLNTLLVGNSPENCVGC